MKKMTLVIVIIIVATILTSCKLSMFKPVDGPGMERDPSLYENYDIYGELGKMPIPMFIIGGDKNYMHMLYWTELDEPQKTDDNAEFFEEDHRSWELQNVFRNNAANYTNLLVGDKIVKMKFVDEVLKAPNGNAPSIGQIHLSDTIPSLCARYAFADKKKTEDDEEQWGQVLVTDDYLQSHKLLDVKSCQTEDDKFPPLDTAIVKQMERKYGMKAARSAKHSIIGGRYIHGIIQFEGEYKDAPKDKYDPDRKYALAIEVMIDGKSISTYEALGYYDKEQGATWNADDNGIYFPNKIVAAFLGVGGLHLCYTHAAPESFAVGMFFPREGKMIMRQYSLFQTMIDE